MKVMTVQMKQRVLAVLMALGWLLGAQVSTADDPYARSRNYDLQHSKVVLRFDVEQREVFGDVTHSVAVLKEGTDRLAFDSVGLEIKSVSVDRKPARFETTPTKLNVTLPRAGHAGEKFEIEIKYQGKPKKGLYFILPDKNYPNRPAQIWTQGESEDTRYYLPTYDYPNDRLTTETVVTVPESWYAISNGKLMGIADGAAGQKVWTWRESLPSSTYLFTVAAGEFAEVKDSWRNIPVNYYAPKDRADRLTANYSRTPAMIEHFSKTLGVDYPWEKYAQVMVDDFVAGGMENSSATTNTSSSLRHPALAAEYIEDEDDLISHELGHQWFGDLVTCKDWGNIWLNEGFATFMETVWTEQKYGKDQADYMRWEAGRGWNSNRPLYAKPIVRHDFDDTSEFDENVYNKGGWVLYMLRHQLGNQVFYAGLKHYLEVNRGKNVVTADLTKAIEEATYTNVDQFFDQWVYGAGAPKFEVSYSYDANAKQVQLVVKQTQKVEGRVGLFRVPVDVEIQNASGPKLYTIVVSKDAETFPFPSETAPEMVLFDKGNQILKSVEFKKEMPELVFQLKNASEVGDRADAAMALSKVKNDASAVALGEALKSDKAAGVRLTAARALGQMETPAASKELLEALAVAKEPWIRNQIVQALGSVKGDATVTAKLQEVAKQDVSWRARGAALNSLAKMKAPGAYETLTAAVNAESPDGFLRDAALRGYGLLGDDRAVPTLREWAKPGKDLEARGAAIGSLGHLEKGNKEITAEIVSYLPERHFEIQLAAIFALGARADASAIPGLEAMLKEDDLSIELAPMIKDQIATLKNPTHVPLRRMHGDEEGGDEQAPAAAAPTGQALEDQRLKHLEQLVEEMNRRLQTIEGRLPAPTPKQ